MCACLQYDQMYGAGLSALLIAQYAELELNLLIHFVKVTLSLEKLQIEVLLQGNSPAIARLVGLKLKMKHHVTIINHCSSG